MQRDFTWRGIWTVDSPYLACNEPGNSLEISYHAPVTAGSTIKVDYRRWPEDDRSSRNIHVIGPMTAFLARCPDEGCEDVDLTDKMWFKIWHAGLVNGTWATGHWAMRDIHNGANLEIPTPVSVKPGKYLLRHDMINLETGPLQMFINCIQLDISGDGDRLPSDEQLLAFPGGFDADLGWSSSPRDLNYIRIKRRDWLADGFF
jgi:lytic cellulose monooxygenase (C1-hydroxylating)